MYSEMSDRSEWWREKKRKASSEIKKLQGAVDSIEHCSVLYYWAAASHFHRKGSCSCVLRCSLCGLAVVENLRFSSLSELKGHTAQLFQVALKPSTVLPLSDAQNLVFSLFI